MGPILLGSMIQALETGQGRKREGNQAGRNAKKTEESFEIEKLGRRHRRKKTTFSHCQSYDNFRSPLTAWANLVDEQAARDGLEATRQSYRNAIRFGADDGRTYARLGFILYALQEDAAALSTLLKAKRRGANGFPSRLDD